MRKTVAIGALAAVLLTSSVAAAQMRPPGPPPPDQQQMAGQGGMQCPMPGGMQGHGMMGPGMMGPGMMGPGMMGAGMMGHGMMGPGMMGGMGAPSDPKAMARMLKFRGDMLKAIGEVMLKHAEAIEKEK
jgi:hypothetical protein